MLVQSLHTMFLSFSMPCDFFCWMPDMMYRVQGTLVNRLAIMWERGWETFSIPMMGLRPLVSLCLWTVGSSLSPPLLLRLDRLTRVDMSWLFPFPQIG